MLLVHFENNFCECFSHPHLSVYPSIQNFFSKVILHPRAEYLAEICFHFWDFQGQCLRNLTLFSGIFEIHSAFFRVTPENWIKYYNSSKTGTTDTLNLWGNEARRKYILLNLWWLHSAKHVGDNVVKQSME